MKNPSVPPRSSVLGRGSYGEVLRIGEILRKETVGGVLLVAAAVIALVWANSPASESYFALRDFKHRLRAMASGTEPGGLGSRWSVGDLLLPGGAGAQT